jgi:Arylsulfotransferase (ASST)/Ser-Thr-rich glycosyl-phosphatidyl-inositol-anchored membrane family
MFRAVLYLFIGVIQCVAAQEPHRYEYIFPKPNSHFVSAGANIILRPGKPIDVSSMSGPSAVAVEGAVSGTHSGRTILSDDHKTIVFNPDRPFMENERIIVTVSAGLRTVDGASIDGYRFEFRTSAQGTISASAAAAVESSLPGGEESRARQQSMTAVLDSLPADFPSITINALDNPAPGELFMAPFIGAGVPVTNANYLAVLDNAGKPLAIKRIGLGINPFPYMFKAEPNGVYSYIDRTPTTTSVKILDTLFTVTDTYPKGDPAAMSHADFHLLPNGHALVLYFDKKTIDMSLIVKGGNPAASVQGTLVQEFDLQKNVVFQWSSFDYQAITDTYEDTLAAAIDYSHANNVTLDTDGNILLSNRHLSEITKIDRNTGEIIWRLGGKHNEFTFLNEHQENAPLFFSYQHHIQRLANGNITFFDNGNQKSLHYSRAVEYKIDEVKKTVQLVWEYRHTPDIYASAQGCVQRLANGNTLIGWGDAGIDGSPSITEVHPDKSTAFELTLPKGNRSMQVYRLPYRSGRPVGVFTRDRLLERNTYSFNGTSASTQTGVKIRFNVLAPFFYNIATVQKIAQAPLMPQFAGRAPWMASQRIVLSQMGMETIDADLIFDAAQLTGIPDPNLVRVFRRDTAGSGYFTALPTDYNSVTNELTANTTAFGEFIFCWSDADTLAGTPITVLPVQGDSVNERRPVGFLWRPRGYATGYHLQAATDSLFRSLVVNDSLLTTASDTLRIVKPGAKYFWRVRARNFTATGAWSDVRRFTAAAPYISVTAPAGAEAWPRGYQYFIRWASNSTDRVRIDLFKGPARFLLIKDSVSNTGTYTWTIPSSMAADTAYKIRIASVADSALFGMSPRTFAITSAAAGVVDDLHQVPAEFGLDQNYPNPFNPSTAISFRIPIRAHVTLTVFTVLGREAATLFDDMMEPGSKILRFDASGLASGVYFYVLKAGHFIQSKKLVVVK